VTGGGGRLRLAVLYGAEPYQAYHVSDIAAALSRDAQVELTILTVDPAIDPLLERLETGQFARPVPHERLYTSLGAKLLRRARLFGNMKKQVLGHPRNLGRLADFDAVITPTTHLALMRDRVPRSTRFVYVYHGAGARQMSYSPKMRAFDLVLPPGQATVDRLVADGLVREGHAVAIGLPKAEACRRLAAAQPPLFDNDKPTVLFNPHSQRQLRSWEKFAGPLIEHAARTGEFNLIVAPHVKLFARRPRAIWRRWEKRAVPGRVYVDLGSDASLDMRYTLAADIYAGDVSSQVYEFLTEPKPCVFLNAHGADWRDSRDYPMWRLGEVAETPEQAMQLIRSAAADHPRFAELQREERRVRIGELESGSAERAARLILSFLREGRA
jgi:hypothetical protein